MTARQFDIILYHARGKGIPCTDGWLSALSAWIYNPGIETMGIVYGDEPPWQAIYNRRVLIADVSWDRSITESVRTKTEDLQVIDHHATAQENLRGLPYCLFDMTRSGCLMTWQFFFPDKPAPALIRYGSDADLFAWKLPNSREISSWMQSFEMRDMKDWLKKLEQLEKPGGIDMAIMEGRAILRSKEQMLKVVTHRAEVIETAIGNIAVANSPLLQSEAGEVLSKQHGRAAIWYMGDGEIVFSLRSDSEEHDVSQLARALGGGGHKQASGAKVKMSTVETLPLSQVVSSLLKQAARKVTRS